jgi:hypothetical protein
LVAPYEVSENRPTLDPLWRSCLRGRIWPHHVTGDGNYGTAENVAAVEQASVRAFVGLHRNGDRPYIFGKEDFTYDPKRGCLRLRGRRAFTALGKMKGEVGREGKVTTYRAKASSCKTCALRARFTSNKLGRNLSRGPSKGA